MPPVDDRDKPPLSWREIDRLRDGSGHTRDDRPPSGSAPRRIAGAPVAQYKRDMDRVFFGANPASVDQGSRPALLARIRGATDRAVLVAAADMFIAKGYSWPDDIDVFVQLLDHSDESRVKEALDRIVTLAQHPAFKHGALLDGRLRNIENIAEEAETRDLAHRIRIGRS